MILKMTTDMQRVIVESNKVCIWVSYFDQVLIDEWGIAIAWFLFDLAELLEEYNE